MEHVSRALIYKIGELIARLNISNDRVNYRCRSVVVHDQVLILYGRGVCKSIHKPLAVTYTYLVRHGVELRRVLTITKH